MKITVRLFAILRERAGSDSVSIELADGATVADALEALALRPELTELIERMPVRMAVNRDYADPQTSLSPEDELALVPPVSGGADPGSERGEEIHARITERPLSVDSLSRAVSRPGAGAVVIFQGTTRDVDHLEYEAYAEMAEERLRAILSECCERHGLEAAAAEHRVGAVPLGQPSVVVAVAAPHRSEAFAAAREAIDRIKAEAPIWKKEVERGGARWVEGTAAPEAGARGAGR